MSIKIFTDGACLGNPGAGGWGAIVRESPASEKCLSGGTVETTNNRMELTAVIQALKAVDGAKKEITVTTDSAYVVNAVKQGWLKSWRASGWRLKSGGKAKNDDLWNELWFLLEKHNVQFEWVKGHAGHPENERCDAMASREASNYNLLAMRS